MASGFVHETFDFNHSGHACIVMFTKLKIDMRNMFLACAIIKRDMNGINVFHALFCSLPITGRGHYFSVRSLSNKRFRER
jgi:hypothetical protein